jgi:hypothetical protein
MAVVSSSSSNADAHSRASSGFGIVPRPHSVKKEDRSVEMPKPGPEQLQLQKLAGKWRGEETISPSPFDPKGGPATGKVDNRVACDGWIVVQEYEQTRNGKVNFKGVAVFSHDVVKKAVVMNWYDSMAGGPFPFTGNWKGDVLSLHGPAGDNGQGRCTFEVSGDTYKFKMEVSMDGKSWNTFMTGLYRRGAV